MTAFYIQTLIIGHIFIFLGFLIVRFPMLIAGYNTMPKKEREKIDIKPIAQIMRKYLVFMGAGIMTVSPILRWVGLEHAISTFFIIIIGGGTVLMLIHINYIYKRNPLKYNRLSLWFLIAVLAVAGVFIVYSMRAPSIQVEDSLLTVSGNYGVTVPLSSIERAELIEELPVVELRTNGFSLHGVRKGYFRLEGIPKALFFLQSTKAPYLVIYRGDDVPIFINRSATVETRTLYDQIKQTI